MLPLFVIAAAAGGATMYLFDPAHGRRRRALLRDQTLRARTDIHSVIDAGIRDLANRASALRGKARSMLVRRSATDHVLVERVRSKMGRYVAHPSAVEVSALGGEVTLSGSILAHEHSDFVDVVGEIDGVKNVIDRLSVFETAEGISELQGERQRSQRAARNRNEWTPGARLIVGAAGAALALYAMRGSVRGLLLGTVGALLLVRSPANEPLRTPAGTTKPVSTAPEQSFDNADTDTPLDEDTVRRGSTLETDYPARDAADARQKVEPADPALLSSRQQA
jgi:hypothetical protein